MSDLVQTGRLSSDSIRCPGLTSGAPELHELAEELPKSLAVFSYKESMPCLWVVFVGGTGTGKSTLFNALCGESISETGVERPRTSGPVVYAHQDCPLEEHFPFAEIQVERLPLDTFDGTPVNGNPGRLVMLEHNSKDASQVLFVDTPDIDSVEPENRQIAQDIYLLSDAVVFVTSQEKYADEVPYDFLVRIVQDNTPYFFLLNKVGKELTKEEAIGVLQKKSFVLKDDRVWLIPYAPSDPLEWISENTAFQDFLQSFLEELSPQAIKNLRDMQHERRTERLRALISRALNILEEEDQAAQEWLKRLETVYEEVSGDLISDQKQCFTADTREHLNVEIKKLFSRYDVLAKPRRFVRELFLTPLRLLGILQAGTHKGRKEGLLKVRRKIQLASIQAAIQKFNRNVLERLSPADETSLLFVSLRQAGVALSEEEIEERIWEEQDKLGRWLEKTFQKLSRGIPKHKEVGIYATSIIWGILILSFEIVVGGGFTMLDVALDGAIAPFLTKGATELFARHEIQQVARELSKRYEEGLLSVVRDQRDHYKSCLLPLVASRQTVEYLEELRIQILGKKPLVVK
ncbi:MAG: GTPase domain-containing protein [Deltaproteobacteria bacterium]|nr:GTPase domain-containing protein [Deltaproteobacteria bacterium]